MDILQGGLAGIVPGQKGIIVLLGFKQGGHSVHQAGAFHTVLQPGQGIIKEHGLIIAGAQGRAHGGEAVCVLRENSVILVQLQGSQKPLPQPHKKVQGTTQENDFSFQFPSLSQAGHRLVHHRLKNGGSHILFSSPLIEDGLDVTFGEHAATAGNGVQLLML